MTTKTATITKTTLRTLAGRCGYTLVEGLSWQNMPANVARSGKGYYGLRIGGSLKTFMSGRECAAFMESVLADWAALGMAA